MQSDANFPLVRCKPSSQRIQPKFNQCKRFVLHPHFSFIYLTISILGLRPFSGSLKYTLRFVPSTGIHIIELSTIKWNILTFDRNNKSYQCQLHICYFLTEDNSDDNRKGKYKMKSFTDEHLCRLFEKFCLRIL